MYLKFLCLMHRIKFFSSIFFCFIILAYIYAYIYIYVSVNLSDLFVQVVRNVLSSVFCICVSTCSTTRCTVGYHFSIRSAVPFRQSRLTIGIWTYFFTLYSIPLTCISVCPPKLHCVYHCDF